MTLAASWELQKAIHAALVANASLASWVGTRIYDRPPGDVSYPFITLGDTDVIASGNDEEALHRLTLIVWSRENGRREAKEILSAIHVALHEAPLVLSGYKLVNLQFEQASLVHAADAEALRGKIRFRAYTETII